MGNRPTLYSYRVCHTIDKQCRYSITCKLSKHRWLRFTRHVENSSFSNVVVKNIRGIDTKISVKTL